MFHYSNFGMFSTALKHLSDRDGYVPEPGDDVRLFVYDDMTPDEWLEHVSHCARATAEAGKALHEWAGYEVER